MKQVDEKYLDRIENMKKRYKEQIRQETAKQIFDDLDKYYTKYFMNDKVVIIIDKDYEKLKSKYGVKNEEKDNNIR